MEINAAVGPNNTMPGLCCIDQWAASRERGVGWGPMVLGHVNFREDSSLVCLDMGLGDLFGIKPEELVEYRITHTLEEGGVDSQVMDIMLNHLERSKLGVVVDCLDASGTAVRNVLGLQNGLSKPKKNSKAPLVKHEFFNKRDFEGEGLAPMLKQRFIKSEKFGSSYPVNQGQGLP